MSQEALAHASGVSRRMIVNLEGGDTNISLAKLSTLAQCLGVEFTAMVSDPNASAQRVDELLWRGAKTESAARLLGSAPASSSSGMAFWSLAVGDGYTAEPDPPGWHEMVFVTEGSLRITKQDGDVVVGAGDFAIYSSAQEYSFANAGDAAVRFVKVVVS